MADSTDTATAAPATDDWDTTEVERVLLEPYDYITSVPGKEVRATLIQSFNVWMKIPAEKLDLINDITRMLHNASLLIDDIQDNSKLRRGIPVAHNIYGVATTINTANYVYFLCMQKVLELNHPDAMKAFTEQLLELHRGQGMDIYWRDASICPSEAEYRAMVLRKTGGLFGLAVRLMQLFSECTLDFSNLLECLGLHFQIRDDYANLKSKDYEANKSFAEDFTEGKFSFPIIHSIHATPMNHQVINILRQRTEDNELKRFAITCIEASGSFDYTRTVLEGLEADSLAELKKLGGNKMLHALIGKLSQMHKVAPGPAATPAE